MYAYVNVPAFGGQCFSQNVVLETLAVVGTTTEAVLQQCPNRASCSLKTLQVCSLDQN